MVKEAYRQAFTEVYVILKSLPLEEYNKIPKKKITEIEENSDKNYKFEIDVDKPLNMQRISKEANAILISIFKQYFATESQKEKLEILLRNNFIQQEKDKRNKYNPDNMFKSKTGKTNDIEKKENSQLPDVVKKQGIFLKILKVIKKFLIFKK